MNCNIYADYDIFSGTLKRIVFDTVASMLVLPNKFSIKLSEEVDIMELKTPEPEVRDFE